MGKGWLGSGWVGSGPGLVQGTRGGGLRFCRSSEVTDLGVGPRSWTGEWAEVWVLSTGVRPGLWLKRCD